MAVLEALTAAVDNHQAGSVASVQRVLGDQLGRKVIIEIG